MNRFNKKVIKNKTTRDIRYKRSIWHYRNEIYEYDDTLTMYVPHAHTRAMPKNMRKVFLISILLYPMRTTFVHTTGGMTFAHCCCCCWCCCLYADISFTYAHTERRHTSKKEKKIKRRFLSNFRV